MLGNDLVKGKVPAKLGVMLIPAGQALDKLPRKFLKVLSICACAKQKEEELDLSDSFLRDPTGDWSGAPAAIKSEEAGEHIHFLVVNTYPCLVNG